MRPYIGNLYKRTGGFLLPAFFFALSILSLMGCGPLASTDQHSNEPIPAQKTTSNDDQRAMPKVFATLPRSFDGALRLEIKEAIPLEPENKPGAAGPRHVYLVIEGGNADRGSNSTFTPGIAVYEVEKFRDQLSAQPATVASFDENLNALRSLLSEKLDLTKQGEIEIVRYVEDMQALRAHASYLPFQGGCAVGYITQFMPDASYVNNRELTYVLQGLTSDGKYYLFGTFPVRVGFLPEDSDISDFEGYRIPMYSLTEVEAQENFRYLRRIETRLENTPPEKFQPDLREIEKLISSIEIRE
jgi:hypothetical protein